MGHAVPMRAPRRSRTTGRLLLVALLCTGLAACGGGGGDDHRTPSPSSGEHLFSQRCGGCHTLSAARTTGKRGVNFDYRKVSQADALFAMRNGGFSGGPMPKNIVVGEDAETVARFVAQASGSKASGDLDSPDVRRMLAAPAGSDAGTIAAPTSGISTAFLRGAFDSAQALWRQKFTAAGLEYHPARLVFFHDTVSTGCGEQSAQTGPFYCPADHGVYLNTDFFDALGRRFGLNSPFAPGYVTAHEVAHHVQQLLSLHHRVALANAQDPGGENPRSVRVELQADCYAGIWLHFVARAGQLTQADVTDILRAAAVVGDDFQRNKAGVELAPETWTHGSSQQRIHWLSVGKDSGRPADCDTFATGP
jgi:predicted metalloprotease